MHKVPAEIAALQHATISLGSLISRYELGLITIAGARDSSADTPVQWVHGSDLIDPTPFLTPRTVLLTTGAQFSAGIDAADSNAYISRLQAAGVCALGFAIGIQHERIPLSIIRSCDELGLPLFRVPYDTPFIAISQTAARMIDAEMHARDAWILDTQRAIAGAALHRDGIVAAVHELSARLARWIIITDPRGRVLHRVSGVRTLDQKQVAWARDEAAKIISRGVRSSRTIERDGTTAEFQTLGQGKRLLGALIVERETPLDHAEHTALGLVATLATVQLDHSSRLAESEAEIRSAILRLLIDGDRAAAERLADTSATVLPREPLRMFDLGDESSVKRTFLEDVRSWSAERTGSLLGSIDDSLIMLIEQLQMPAAFEFLRTGNGVTGVSTPASYDELSAALHEAQRAREIAEATGVPVVQYRPAMSIGVLGLLSDNPDARRRALSLLEPLASHDETHNDAIVHTLQTWLAHHGQLSAAANELGVHRHTVRSRVDAAANLLQRDVNDPDVRAELWAAFRLLR